MDEPQTVSKTTFGCLTLSLVGLFGCIATIVSLKLTEALHLRREPSFVGGFAFLYLILARATVDRVLRWLGLSRSGKTIEVYARSGVEPSGKGLPDGAAEARLSKGMKWFMLVASPIMCLLFFTLGTPKAYKESVLLNLMTLAVGSFFLYAFVFFLLESGKPQARVDAKGVTGYPSPRALRRRFIPWTQISSCEVLTTYNTFGEPVLLRPIFRDRDGETLIELYLAFTPIVEQERLVKFIKTKLPETELDPWLM